MRYIFALLLMPALAAAQNSQTTCEKMGNQTNCRTTQQQTVDYGVVLRAPEQSPAPVTIIQAPQRQSGVTDAEFRQLQMLAAQEQKALAREQREKDARFAKFMTQTEACIQLHPDDEKGVRDCVNTLKITDPDYARGFAEANDPQAAKEFADALLNAKRAK